MPSGVSGSPVLRAGRLGGVVVAVVSLTFAAAGLYLVAQDERRGLAVAGFFGLTALLAVAMLVYGHANLRLAEDGFAVGRIWRDAAYRWTDVSPFEIVSIHGSGRVGFDVPGDHGILANLARKQFGASAILPDSYGMKAEELADLMNAWRTAALNPAAGGDEGQATAGCPRTTSTSSGGRPSRTGTKDVPRPAEMIICRSCSTIWP